MFRTGPLLRRGRGGLRQSESESESESGSGKRKAQGSEHGAGDLYRPDALSLGSCFLGLVLSGVVRHLPMPALIKTGAKALKELRERYPAMKWLNMNNLR